jgi:hypothetical protein
VNYLRGDTTTGQVVDSTQVVDSATGLVTSGTEAAVNISKTVKYWEGILTSSADAMQKARARVELARLGLSSARIDMIASGKRMMFYYGGIGFGVLLIGGLVYFSLRKKRR